VCSDAVYTWMMCLIADPALSLSGGGAGRQSAGELGQRLNAVLQPQLRLLTRSAAAGEGSPGSALFLGDAAVRGPSAVGAVFRGPAAGLDNLVSHLLACQHEHSAEAR